jgi:hypothetical protein
MSQPTEITVKTEANDKQKHGIEIGDEDRRPGSMYK